MLFNICKTNRNGESVVSRTVDTSQPKVDGSPRKNPDSEKAALRMFGLRILRTEGDTVYGYAKSGVKYWAEPVKVKSEKGNKSPVKVKSQKVKSTIPENFDPAIHATDENGAPVYKLDGTLAKRRGRKPAAITVKPQDAPYGYKKDGVTPKKAPGRKKNKSVSVKSQKVNKSEGKSLTPKDEFNAMLDGSIPMDTDRLRELTAMIVAAA